MTLCYCITKYDFEERDKNGNCNARVNYLSRLLSTGKMTADVNEDILTFLLEDDIDVDIVPHDDFVDRLHVRSNIDKFIELGQ